MAAASTKQGILLCLVLFTLLLPSSAQTCNLSNRLYTSCNVLPQLSSSLHWTYNASTSTVDIAYQAQQSSNGWIAWALNPTGVGMVGAQALVTLQQANGSMKVWTTPIEGFRPNMTEGKLSFNVTDLTAVYNSGVMTIFAKIVLPENRTSINHVWQESTSIENGYPSGHSFSGANVQSSGTIDFLSGDSTSATDPRLRRKNVHGVLNAVSWGVLMPLGIIIARYMRVFESADPAWFYLHVTCQCSAYIIGVAGWGTGLKLGSDSHGITHDVHRNIGIALFCLATLQVFALLLRPQKDHKYRIYWNFYHHGIGYSVLILSIINIFKGFDILDPEKKWKNAYIGIIIALGAIFLILEVVTWYIVLQRRSRKNAEKSYNVADGQRNQMA